MGHTHLAIQLLVFYTFLWGDECFDFVNNGVVKHMSVPMNEFLIGKFWDSLGDGRRDVVGSVFRVVACVWGWCA